MSNHYDYALLKSFGQDSFISAAVEIRRPHLVTVGNHTALDTGFYCTVAADIGDYVHVAPYCTAIGGEKGYWKMDHFAGVSAGCRIICVSNDFLGGGLIGPTVPEEFTVNISMPVIFEKFALLGTNAVVMPGVTLAEGSVIGANSLITKSTEPWTIYAGSPAKPIKSRKKETMLDYARRLGYDV